MAIGLAAGIVSVLDHLWNALRCRCHSDCAYNEILVPEPSIYSGPTRQSHSSIMSAVTKSTDPRYAGRSYIDAPEVYAARVARADELKAEGKSHKAAWYQAFKEFPRTYLDALAASSSDSQPSSFVFPPGVQSAARGLESLEL